MVACIIGGVPFEMDMKSIHKLLFSLFLELIPENIRNVVAWVLIAIGLLFSTGIVAGGSILKLAGFFVFVLGVIVLPTPSSDGRRFLGAVNLTIAGADAISESIKSFLAGDEVDEANQHDGGEHCDSASTPESNNGREAATAPMAQEISCPQCNQRLNVPSNYTGLVGCPSCKEKIQLDEGGISVTE